jgi:hypothetical protein
LSRARRVVRGIGLGLAALAVSALLLAGLLYLNRRAAARELLTGWLEKRGVPSEVEIERIELDGLVARVRVGDPRDPDFAAERVEVDYVIGAPWSARGLGLTPARVRLVRPVLKARWADGKLSLGALDPIVEEFTRRPPGPDSRAPLVLVEHGRVNLDTDHGRLAATADARVDDGRLIRLDARLPETRLQGRDGSARGLTGAVTVTTRGDRIRVRLDVAADQASAGDLELADGGAATLTGDLPYPDLKRRRGDGRAALSLDMTTAALRMGRTRVRGLAARAAFDGTVGGWIDAFRIIGRSDLNLRAAELDGAGTQGAALTLAAANGRLNLGRDATGLSWRLDGPTTAAAGRLTAGETVFEGLRLTSSALTVGGRGAAAEAVGPAVVAARGFRMGDLALDDVSGRAALDARFEGATLIQARGALHAANGRWPLFGPTGRDDPADLAAMKQALGDFRLSVPAFRLVIGSPGATVALDRPVELRPRNGGVLRLASMGGRPVFSARPGEAGGGAAVLTAERGRGLPELAVDAPDWRLTPGGFQARIAGRGALDFDLFRGVTVRTAGLLTSAGGRLTYAADDCAAVTVERLELDENDVTDLSGRFCPEGAPLVAVEDGGWSARGRLAAVDASAPFLAMRFSDAEGALRVAGGANGVSLNVRVDQARVLDATAPRRFNPLTASGEAGLANETWSGGFDLTSGEAIVGRLVLAHDGRTGVGGVTIETPMLQFAEGGFQPGGLSPLVQSFVQSPATGAAQFSGRIDWTADGEGSSGGRLIVPGLDFLSPAGPVKGLKGRIDFTSLIPLVTAPGQTLTADSLESLTPLTDAQVQFAIDKAGVSVAAADIHVASGVVRVLPFVVPLDPTQGFNGVIELENVQLGELLAGSGFGDKASLDAVVSGRLPFTSEPGRGVRVSGGSLRAVQPGRLSIQREALSAVETGGGGTEVPPNTVQDMAYQAMENLAFDTLTADVNSLEAGRLGVLFHIKGRHDPPQRQELRLSLSELISRDFLKRDLPLPSGTGVDLTLDTTLNADQLVSDLLALNRARNGDANEP